MPKASSVGILGAGQLGAYLCLAGRKLGLQTTVVANSPDDPAVAVADSAIIDSTSSLAAAQKLLMACDVITFEREDIDGDVLKMLARHAYTDTGGVFPHPDVLVLLGDKARQKQWLVSNGLPTPKFMLCSGGESAADISNELGSPFIQKACRGGFDGRGVQKLTELDDDLIWPGVTIAEKLVNYEREIAVLVARSRHGEMQCFPVVDVSADTAAHQLAVASSPSTLSEALCSRAKQLGRDIVSLLDGVGVFAIEMFVTEHHHLLVNEISPRVHNTGHLTIEANRTSQFEQHMRAICGFKLGLLEQRVPAAMKNIVHHEKMRAVGTKSFQREQLDSGMYIHWYGKKEPRSLRKMGHLTVLAPTVEEARAHAELKYSELSQPRDNVA